MDNIVFDCDNTFGVRECPVDDGLALLYLLGKPQARLTGVTTTYGNSNVDVVYDNTKNMLLDLGRTDIPVLKGGASKNNRKSEAAEFLVEQANLYPGSLKILATGALTNLCAAYELDHEFFGKVKEIVLMGGITESLFLNGVKLDELNFSCDPEASCCVLTNGRNVSIATGNNCLPAYIRHEDYKSRLLNSPNPVGRYIYEQTKSWFDVKVKMYDLNGFYAWDEVSAVYLLEKAMFADYRHRYAVTPADLERGFIGNQAEALTHEVNLPTIRDVEAFKEELYANWLRVSR
ncbi:purine nucleosidase [Sporobacter termitidis DSM 10068]|uniref:Purine nucleosidase n=1 Tax=Sporobacter termitidis DSM 10068 TaxID=1123282 RepID=A0A1M5WAF8_9FIRM|nr:nucleoside hydrolase [Sporobacter termitidis]SHH84418.1 purine nucleosidase [Sporobacter termitidis DSM 10068]